MKNERNASIRDGNPKAYPQPTGLYSNGKIFLITTHVDLPSDLQKRCIMFTVDEAMKKETNPCPEYLMT